MQKIIGVCCLKIVPSDGDFLIEFTSYQVE